MGATADKIKGTANEAIGKAKQGIGEATGSDRLQGEGVIQEVKGKGQKAVGDAKDATKEAANKAAAAATTLPENLLCACLTQLVNLLPSRRSCGARVPPVGCGTLACSVGGGVSSGRSRLPSRRWSIGMRSRLGCCGTRCRRRLRSRPIGIRPRERCPS
jgi:uncharacterized protein YjbJ (UPF0337 family)